MTEFNGAKRKELKRRARAGLRPYAWEAVGVQYTAFLISVAPLLALAGYALWLLDKTGLLQQLIRDLKITAGQPSFAMNPAAMDGDTAMLLLGVTGKLTGMFFLCQIAGILIQAVFACGSNAYFIAVSRNKQAHFGDLFCAIFKRGLYVKSLRMVICLMFRSFLWSAVPDFIFTSYSGMMGAVGRPLPPSALIAYQLVMFLISIKVQTYAAGWIFILDESTSSAWEATKRGAQLFRGRLFDLLVFTLSFLPWGLLAIVIYVPLAAAAVLTVLAGNTALTAIAVTTAVFLWLAFLFYVLSYMQTAFLNMCFYLDGQDEPGFEVVDTEEKTETE